MNKIFSALAIGVAIFFASCDGHHDVPDSGMKVGDILCTDGQILSYSDWQTSEKHPIGVVFHVNYDKAIEGKGYVVYLDDLAPAEFADSLGVKQNTSADINAFDGNQNTYNLMSGRNVSSPIAEKVFSLWCYGQSAYIPSVAELRLLYANRGIVNSRLNAIGGQPIGTEPDECWYWSSTEVAGQETHKAWLYSLGQGAIHETPKIEAHKIRPIITIND